MAPDAAIARVPVADGGDGTVDAALAAGFTRVAVRAHGPAGALVDTAFAVRDGVAVIEMAGVSGLRLLSADRLDALRASPFGVGEVICAAMRTERTTLRGRCYRTFLHVRGIWSATVQPPACD